MRDFGHLSADDKVGPPVTVSSEARVLLRESSIQRYNEISDRSDYIT